MLDQLAGKKWLHKLSFVTILISLVASYWPRLDFGSMAGINLKIPLSLMLLAVFVGLSLPVIYSKRQQIIGSFGVQAMTLLIILGAFSLIWTENIVRGASEVTLLVGLWAVFVAVYAHIKNSADWLKDRFYLYTSVGLVVFICLFAIWQLIGEAYGVPAAYTLLPHDYQSAVFGFARPTGFGLEPEFFGSLLLIPTLVLSYVQLRKNRNIWLFLLTILVITTVGLTLSRGVYIALAISLLVLIIMTKSDYRERLKLAGIIAISIVAALGLMTLAAQINNRDNISGPDAFEGSVNHISLGVIEFDSEPELKKDQTIAKPTDQPAKPVTSKQPADNKPGYVEESTSSRLTMTSEALRLWSSSVKTALIGIGQGGFGAELHKQKPNHSMKSIVNNQYVSTLAELGVIGLLSFLTLLIAPVYALAKRSNWLLVSLLVAFYVQWLFFSGNINVIHVWVVLAIGYAAMGYNGSRGNLHGIKSTNQKTD